MATSILLLAGCQHISTRTLNFTEQSSSSPLNWISQHTSSAQQKKALLRVNRAQQRIKQLDFSSNAQLFKVTKQNQVANYCAMTTGITLDQIDALKALNFKSPRQAKILARYEQDSPRIKLDINAINCDFD
ncbi:MAG: hypothetical protein EOO69_11670 [Moraxellaceae bacterium]|nr:MAG: hypothetical protein EOO69_11670 [Moraxellaceae bacterium]